MGKYCWVWEEVIAIFDLSMGEKNKGKKTLLMPLSWGHPKTEG